MNKQELINDLQEDWERYWHVELFDQLGFERKQCESCNSYFWTLQGSRETCGEAPCDPYSFIGIERKDWSYTRTWEEVEKFFEDNGHESVPRYPVMARWRPDLYFTNASIIDFQRKSPRGVEFSLPANPLVVPQVCLRFNDIDNVGKTGRHHTSFIMVGQHAIPQGGEGYWKDETIRLDWELCTEVFGIGPEKITFKEDAWAGGGAAGYSLEYIADGLELGNAVFTEFRETSSGLEEMATPVVDMGGGLDRWVWYLNGTLTSYDSAFGPVAEKMREEIEYDGDLFARYSRLAGSLDFEDPVASREAMGGISDELGYSENELDEEIGSPQAVYTVADFSKSLLFALTDGGIPASTGAGYNLRVILRRAQGLIEEYDLPFSLLSVMRWHADHLEEMHPELEVDGRIEDIVETELEKYKDTTSRAKQRVESLVSSGDEIGEEELIELYDSEGISPEMIEREAEERGMEIEMPSDFYAKVAERHMGDEEERGRRFDSSLFPATEQLCYDDVFEHDAEVEGVRDGWVVLDRSAFYPEGGGQRPDRGKIGGVEVTDVQKEGDVVFHKVEDPDVFSEGDSVKCRVDEERREKITKHHDATHIISGCARKILGPHAWQHGALKEEDHARIDVTHYKPLGRGEVRKMEECANSVVRNPHRIEKTVMDAKDAEEEHGFEIYQGGVPWGNLRIVEIEGHDVEACGGTHADSTGGLGKIIIKNTRQVQDGVQRIEFLVGEAAEHYVMECEDVVKEVSGLLDVPEENVTEGVRELIDEWKEARKELEEMKEERAHRVAHHADFREVRDIRMLAEHVQGDRDQLQKISEELTADDTLIFLFGSEAEDGKVPVFASAGAEASMEYQAGKVLKEMMGEFGGKGGGSPSLAQGAVPADNITEAMEWLEKKIK